MTVARAENNRNLSFQQSVKKHSSCRPFPDGLCTAAPEVSFRRRKEEDGIGAAGGALGVMCAHHWDPDKVSRGYFWEYFFVTQK